LNFMRVTLAYHPKVLLALPFYGYATEVFSGRKLEQATYDSGALRYITVSQHPDHDTIATFKKGLLRELKPSQPYIGDKRDKHNRTLKEFFSDPPPLCEGAGDAMMGFRRILLKEVGSGLWGMGTSMHGVESEEASRFEGDHVKKRN
jgi:hypothetical protein